MDRWYKGGIQFGFKTWKEKANNLKYRSLLRPSVAMVGNSGADPSLPLGKIRKDQSGRPAMPADNTTFLGKLLFSDQLIAVELAGLLLLVATIGAIVIVRQLPTKVSS